MVSPQTSNVETSSAIARRPKISYGICSDAPFSYHLRRLEQRELIVSGSDIVGVDAVYNLLSNLFVVPISSTFFDRVFVFAKMLIRGVPTKVARGVFAKISISEAENKVLVLAKKQLMSTAELIRCSTLVDPDLSSQDAMVSSIYSIDNLNSDNIATFSKFSEMQEPVTAAVAKLYLKQKVMFEKYA